MQIHSGKTDFDDVGCTRGGVGGIFSLCRGQTTSYECHTSIKLEGEGEKHSRQRTGAMSVEDSVLNSSTTSITKVGDSRAHSAHFDSAVTIFRSYRSAGDRSSVFLIYIHANFHQYFLTSRYMRQIDKMSTTIIHPSENGPSQVW